MTFASEVSCGRSSSACTSLKKAERRLWVPTNRPSSCCIKRRDNTTRGLGLRGEHIHCISSVNGHVTYNTHASSTSCCRCRFRAEKLAEHTSRICWPPAPLCRPLDCVKSASSWPRQTYTARTCHRLAASRPSDTSATFHPEGLAVPSFLRESSPSACSGSGELGKETWKDGAYMLRQTKICSAHWLK